MGKATKVLIVEDEVLIAKVMQIEMLSKGYDVIGIATTVEHAHELIASSRPDIVTLDYNLSGNTTEAFAHYLKRRNIPFIMATANPLLAIAAIGFEPDGYVAKPYAATNVTDCLRESLSSRPTNDNINAERADFFQPVSAVYSRQS